MTGPVLIVGVGGRLGRALHEARPETTVGLSRAALDITDAHQIAAALDRLSPLAVINAAAMAAVDACETDFDAAVWVNGLGPGLLAEACAARALPFIHVSTDYVFGAEGHDRPRRETDSPCPINAYGRSKLLGEERVLATGGRSVIVRTAWLFGFKGDFIDRMAQKALQHAPLQITEQKGSPTPVRTLAGALLQLADRLTAGAEAPAVLHLAGAPVTTRADWVERALLAAAPGQAVIERVLGEAFAHIGAARPLGTPLDCSLAATVFDLSIDWRPAAEAYRLEKGP